MSKVFLCFFFLLNFQGNIKGISLVWSQSIKTPIINILTEVIMSLNIFLKYEVVRLVVYQSFFFFFLNDFPRKCKRSFFKKKKKKKIGYF